MAKSFRVTLKRSLISTTKSQRETARCLGLSRPNDVVVIKDGPAMRGQILKIQHLLDVQVEN